MREIKKSFWDIITVTGTTVLSIPLMVLSESIQARYLGPAGYGKVALIISAISLLYLFGMSWLERSVLRFGKEEFLQENHFRKTTGNLVMIGFLSLLVTILIFYLFQEPIFTFLEIQYRYAFPLICIGLLLTVVRVFLLEALKVVRLIKVQSFLLRLANKIFVLGGMLILIFIILKINVINVVIVFLLTDIVISLIALFFLKLRYFFPIKIDNSYIKNIVFFSLPLLFTSWSGYVINWIDTYVIKYFMTLEDVGIYQAAYKILNTLHSFWGVGLITITTPIVLVFKSKSETNKINDLYLKRLVPYFCYFTLLAVALIILFSDYGFYLIYGSEFSNSVLPFKILFASHSFTVITYALMAIITSYDMTGMMFILGISSGVINIIADIILVPLFGINGAAVASFIVFSINPLIWYYYVGARFAYPGKLSLFFAMTSIVILVINVVPLSFYERLIYTVSILLIISLLAGRFRLFTEADNKIFNNIDMPHSVRSFIAGLIRLFSRLHSG